jgi:hypothetical protein
MSLRSVLAIGMAAAVLTASWDASAQPGTPQPPVRPAPTQTPGRAFSTSFQPMPQTVAFQVRALNNSPANVRIARMVGLALPRGGVGASPLVVTVETEANPVAVGSRNSRWYEPDGHYYQLRIPIGTPAIEEARGNRARSETDGPRSVQFVLHLTVDNPTTGVRLWDGRAYYTAQSDDEEPAFDGMARILAEMMGRTVRTRAFRLQ